MYFQNVNFHDIRTPALPLLITMHFQGVQLLSVWAIQIVKLMGMALGISSDNVLP